MDKRDVWRQKGDYVCRYQSGIRDCENCEFREICLSQQQSAFLMALHTLETLPVLRFTVLYETSNVHCEVVRNVFYLNDGEESAKEMVQSENNLRFLIGLGLLKTDFCEKVEKYVYEQLEAGSVCRDFLNAYQKLPGVRPVIERGIIKLTDTGKTVDFLSQLMPDCKKE